MNEAIIIICIGMIILIPAILLARKIGDNLIKYDIDGR